MGDVRTEQPATRGSILDVKLEPIHSTSEARGLNSCFNILVLRAGSSSAVRAAQIEFENILALIAHVDTPIRTARNTVDL